MGIDPIPIPDSSRLHAVNKGRVEPSRANCCSKHTEANASSDPKGRHAAKGELRPVLILNVGDAEIDPALDVPERLYKALANCSFLFVRGRRFLVYGSCATPNAILWPVRLPGSRSSSAALNIQRRAPETPQIQCLLRRVTEQNEQRQSRFDTVQAPTICPINKPRSMPDTEQSHCPVVTNEYPSVTIVTGYHN
ncbi:MAG TPA: hypothetical protein VMW15_07820 [Terracidiphilus sp.]|nr:hypothetical protein [Terracidiphilus sp.]